MQNSTLEAIITNNGTWYKVSIISVEYGFSQMLKDGKWVNTTSEPQRFEEEILVFGKTFSSKETAEEFTKGKPFKSIFKNLQKNWK